ncbi:MAG TPA: DCC1-like thiol-disulfide oxidoreductase family protein [Bacteroidia bacterium]|nr:DCC1-like thiol-disulfide oxidoreductase family protein [Bacteroidia bacterium]
MKKEVVKNIILFDGECSFCNASVQYIIKHDSKKIFLFASLQSDFAKKYFSVHSIQSEKINSIILIKGEKKYFKSSAALHIAKNLDAFQKLFFIGILIPPFIRDYFYDYIARNRYRFSQKNNFCIAPNPTLKERFL